jgi:hypothetical protein
MQLIHLGYKLANAHHLNETTFCISPDLVRYSYDRFIYVIKILIIIMLILHIGEGQNSRSSNDIHEASLGDYKLSYFLPPERSFDEYIAEDGLDSGNRILILKDDEITNELTGFADECIVISVVEFGGLIRQRYDVDRTTVPRLIMDRGANFKFEDNYTIDRGVGIMAFGKRYEGEDTVDVSAIQFYLPKSLGSTAVRQCTILSELPWEETDRLFKSFNITKA